jgi:hypothetical protein
MVAIDRHHVEELPRAPRLIGVDDATLATWAELGLTELAPEEASALRADPFEVASVQARMVEAIHADHDGYVPAGPVTFADEEARPHPR